jgi:ribulose-phosphate 3-epimerase
MKKIIPTIFALNKKEFESRFENLVKISKDIQIDLMDGKFVKNKSVSLEDIPNLRRYKNNFEIHLMVENPLKYLGKIKDKNFKKVLFHYECSDNLIETIKKIKDYRMKCFIAINPLSSVDILKEYLRFVDGILIMGVMPGKEGQKIDKNIYSRIKEIRKINKKIDVQIDGGVNLENIVKLKRVGANLFNVGSFVSNSNNSKERLKELNNFIK